MKPAMREGVNAAGFGLVLLMAVTATALSQAPARATDPLGVPVMSDTPQWCAHLAAVVAALRREAAGPRPEVDTLTSQGRRLCGNGHVRQGITRLRYALMRLRDR